MQKRIVPSEINKVSMNMQEKNKYLQEKIKKIKEDIDTISLYYQGEDANILITSYKNRIEELEKVLVNYENLKTYFSNISSVYSDTITEIEGALDTIKEAYDTINRQEEI